MATAGVVALLVDLLVGIIVVPVAVVVMDCHGLFVSDCRCLCDIVVVALSWCV